MNNDKFIKVHTETVLQAKRTFLIPSIRAAKSNYRDLQRGVYCFISPDCLQSATELKAECDGNYYLLKHHGSILFISSQQQLTCISRAQNTR